jgi:protease I
MSRIAVLIGDMFEDVEYVKPAEAFRKAGHELVHVGMEKGKTVAGKRDKTPVRVDLSAGDASVNDFDTGFFPGGYTPDQIRVDPDMVKLAADFVKSGKPVLTICHAPQLLITAKAVQGRRITGWKSIIQDIINAGAEFVDAPVVVDGNLVSSRNPDDIPAFIAESLKKL